MTIAIRKVNPNKPPRTLIYGPEGVGKSTFGARMESPIFITPEGGADQLTDRDGNNVSEMTGVATWDDLLAAIKYLQTTKHGFKTLVLDSADWIEKLCHIKIIGTSGKTMTTVDGGYGSGANKAENMHKALIDQLVILRDQGMAIVVTGHAHAKDVKDPSMLEDYQRFDLKCHDKVSSVWFEWVDSALFVRHATYIVPDGETKTARAVGDGKRSVYTEAQPAFRAKNRYGLPAQSEFTLDYADQYMKVIRSRTNKELNEIEAKQIKLDLEVMYQSLEEGETKTLVRKFIDESGSDVAKLKAAQKKLKTITTGKGSAAK